MQQQGYSIPGYFIIIFCLCVFNSFSVPLLHSKASKFLFMKVNTQQSYSVEIMMGHIVVLLTGNKDGLLIIKSCKWKRNCLSQIPQ